MDRLRLSWFFWAFFYFSCMPRAVWKLSRTHSRSWDLMRREDSSVITPNPDAWFAFQVIRPQVLWVMLMEDGVCLELPWGSLISCIAYIGALGYLKNSSIIWAVVQVTACHRSFGSWDGERESRNAVANSLMSSVVFRVVVIMLTSNNQWQMTFNLKCTIFFFPTVHAGVRVVAWNQ